MALKYWAIYSRLEASGNWAQADIAYAHAIRLNPFIYIDAVTGK